MTSAHQSVLLTEAVDALALTPRDIVVDATIGGAGHFSALLARLGAGGSLIGIDADAGAVLRGQEAARAGGASVHVVHDNFRNLARVLDSLHTPHITKALFDLGWSGYHLSAGRGFSFRADEPLLMTYGEPVPGATAADMVNTASEDALADLLFSLGEERFARGIARAIVRRRAVSPLTRTTDLVAAVEEGTPGWYRHRRIHPATKTFQALRIAVNDELGALREGVSAALSRLLPGGRIAVITFHSIEDRIVKTMLRDAAARGVGQVVTKKPLTPSPEEVSANPRARSAKLRVFERTHTDVSRSHAPTPYAYAE